MSRPKRLIGTILAGLALMLTLGMWALSSPVGASPDEDFHLASVWCGSGERAGLCEPGADDETRRVPDKTLNHCYAFQPQLTASCQGEGFADEGYRLTDTDRVNADGQYPPGFYFVSSLFASDNVAVSTIAIRLFHSFLFTVLVIVTWWVLPQRLRFTLSTSVLLTLVPLGLFVVASPNPSSWAVLSISILFPALLGYFTTSGASRLILGVLAVIGATAGFSSRGDSAAFAGVAVLAAAVLAFRPTKKYLVSAILPAVLLVGAGAAFLAVGQTGRALAGWSDEPPGAGGLTSIVNNFMALPSLWSGAIGLGWGLGWLDTVMPAMLWGMTLLCYVGVLFVALRWQGWRKALALAGVAATMVFFPLYILYTSNSNVGENVQPRYLLPLLTLLLATALAPVVHKDPEESDRAPSGPIRLDVAQVWIVAALLSGAQALALYKNTKRYTGPGILQDKTSWWWEAGPSPLAVCIVGAASFALLLALWALEHQRTRDAHLQAPASSEYPTVPATTNELDTADEPGLLDSPAQGTFSSVYDR